MKIAWIGLGRLGLPCAVSAAYRGHDVVGYDVDEKRMSYDPQPYNEAGPYGSGDFNDYLAISGLPVAMPRRGPLTFAASLPEAVADAEIIFVAVQTPHHPNFEGVTPLGEARMDFDYKYLAAVCWEIAECVKPKQTVAIMSTVLPGTTEREILPMLATRCHVAYNPSFIAMSTTMRDYLNPEFVLIGHEDPQGLDTLRAYYETTVVNGATVKPMSIESAELSKVAYNTAISGKIAIANTMMEICNSIPGADVDAVTDAMQSANRRLTSGAYMTAGMGDGGGCHPRDNIAMSWLAQKLNLSHNIFDDFMRCRDDQAERLAAMMWAESMHSLKAMGVYGYAYKRDTNITSGSPALLVAEFLRRLGHMDLVLVDPMISTAQKIEMHLMEPRVWLIGCNHTGVDEVEWQVGSVIIDPFRTQPDREGVKVIRIGEA